MSKEFEKMPWHDAELQCITIDRHDPGENDQVVLDICWPSGERSKLIFKDCYELEARMNFGVIAPETILSASFFEDSIELDAIRKKWSGVEEYIERLCCYELRTNSTASVLRIYALSYVET